MGRHSWNKNGINAITYATKFGIVVISANDFVTFIEQFINTAEELVDKE